MSTIKLLFDGEEQECLVRLDSDGETVCYAKNGRIVKFPADIDVDAAVQAHNEANAVKPIPADVAASEVDTELLAWLGAEVPEPVTEQDPHNEGN